MSKLISALFGNIQHQRTAVKCCRQNVGCDVNCTLNGSSHGKSHEKLYSTVTGSRFSKQRELILETLTYSGVRITTGVSRQCIMQSNVCFFRPVNAEQIKLTKLQKTLTPRIKPIDKHIRQTTSKHGNLYSEKMCINTYSPSFNTLQSALGKSRVGLMWNKADLVNQPGLKHLQYNQCRMLNTLNCIAYSRVTGPISCQCSVLASPYNLPAEGGLGQKRGMAGHSKWQNIKHTKGTKDVQRGTLFSKLAMKLRIAVRDGGGDDPKFNNQLARVIAEAKSKDMPLTTIETAIKSFGGKDSGSLVVVEMRGPGSCLWVLETFTDKLRKTKMELAGLIKKHGCSLVDGNAAVGAFDKKGILEVDLENPDEPINMDHFLDVAIETGAEDVEQRIDDEDNNILAFITDPDDLLKVKKALEGRQLDVTNYYFDYTARVPAIVGEADLKNLQTLADKLHGHADVMRVFDNIQIADS